MEQASQTYRQAYRQMLAALVLGFILACGISAYLLFQSFQQAQFNAEKTVANLTLSLRYAARRLATPPTSRKRLWH